MPVLSALRDRTPSSESLLNLIKIVQKVQKKSLVYRHSGEIPTLDPPDPTVDVDLATESLLHKVIMPETKRAKFLQFLDDGHVGFIAHDGETLIARGWVCTPASTSVPNNLPAWITDLNAYWLHHGRTNEAYRNRGWHKYMITHRLQWIDEHDPDGPVYTDATPENVSRYTFASIGFDSCGLMRTYRIGTPAIGMKQFGNWDPELTHPPMPQTRDT